MGFANKLMGRGFHPLHRKFDPDLRAETIEVAADRIRVEGNRLVLRGGSVKVSSAQGDDEPRDYVLLRVTGGSQQDGIWSGRLFLFNRLGIAVPSSESELITDLDARWKSWDEGTR